MPSLTTLVIHSVICPAISGVVEVRKATGFGS
jgi:hypothetical protein